MLFACLTRSGAQTFDLNGQSASQKRGGAGSAQTPAQSGGDLSWGSSIEVARQARAAQDALQRNDYAAAVGYATQAAKSAPQNAELWFLLGYAARLNERYPLSVDSYNHGLQLQPNSARGLAGLAQTYAKMGRDADAEQLLRKVVAANPKDANSLQLAGELLLTTDPKAALDLLQRAESLQPSAHSDLLIAHTYERLGQADESQKYLDKAKSRNPRDPEVLRAVAAQYRDQGQYDKAVATLEAIPAKSSDVMAELAYTYELDGKQREAASIYSRLAKSATGNIGLDLSAAQAFINLGQPDQARPFLDAAKQIDENNYRLHAINASVAESEDRFVDARDEYKMALSNLPPRVPEGQLYPVQLRLNLYELDTRQDDAVGAKQELDAAAAALQGMQVLDSSKPEMLRLRAAIEAASGDLDSANRDLKDALALAPANVNSLMNYGTLLWKMGQKDGARDIYKKVLDLDARNRQALSSLGFLARDTGETKLAETYFARAIAAHPKDFGPYLALGDLYTAERNFKSAETNYENAYQRMPDNALVIAGGANAAIEAHNLTLADHWLQRAKDAQNANPQVERERERYLTFKGDYVEAARLGADAIAKLPNDREVVVYLAYDLYYLGKYEDALALTEKYQSILPNDKDLPFIAGNVHAHKGDLNDALNDFTLALQRDPKMAAGYANRGYVLNDMKEAAKAVPDFQAALQIQPDFGEAHLGLAYAELQLHLPAPALTQLDDAQKALGKSHAWHLARAEAFRQEQDYSHAGAEYRIALADAPNDEGIQLAYADVLYHAREYADASAALNNAVKISPLDPAVFALKAQVDAKQANRDQTLHDIQSAEQYGGGRVEILAATGDALLTLGDRNAALQRFGRALDVPGGDRLAVRLKIAEIFLRQGHADEARRQIVIGFAEARLEPKPSVTADDFAQAANLFLAMHDFELAETYFDKAKLSGANSRTVALGLTNTYLAEGDTSKAESELASLGPASSFHDDYDYMMASASLQNQRQDPLHALSALAQASTAAGQQDQGLAQKEEYVAAEQEGRPITDRLSLVPEASFAPVFEDINVYTLDAKILGVTSPALLPPPRHSYQSMGESRYRVHLDGFPVISGFVGQSMTAGTLLFPSVGVVQDRNTYDTIVNGGVTPIVHFGSNSITFNGGLQFTVRRDTISPVFMSQNLFRQFLYISTGSFFNWVSVTANAVREAGPFIDQNLHSRDASGDIEFTVGRPWGSTSLITGYSARDLLFRPVIEEYFNTTSYVGLQHKFGTRLTAAVLAEDLRSWRVQGNQYATAQALLPGGRFDFRANRHWSVAGSFVLSRGEGYHAYDNVQSQFLVSYVRPLRGSLKDGTGEVQVAYPLRVSFGVQQQTFYNFPGSSTTTNLLPVVHLTLF
jgi:tetratricopeptide (TPR) repeat protein